MVQMSQVLHPILGEGRGFSPAGGHPSEGASQAAEKRSPTVILSEDFMILRLTTVHENGCIVEG